MRLTPLFILLLAGALAQPAAASEPLLLPTDVQCSLTSSLQHIDFGEQSYGRYQQLDAQRRQLSPGTRTLQVLATCPYAQPLAVRINGSRTAEGAFAHGPRGALSITLNNALLDGKPVALHLHTAQDDRDYAGGNLALQPDMTLMPVINARQPLAGKQLQLELSIQPVINAQRINGQIHSQSQFQLQLVEP